MINNAMFDNDLMWESYILERRDIEKIQQVEKIYNDYFNKISIPIRQSIDILNSPEYMEKYGKYSMNIDVDFNTLIKRKLDIIFENDKISKSGHSIGGSYVAHEKTIYVFYTELKNIVIDMKNLIRKYHNKQFEEMDEFYPSEMEGLYQQFLQKIGERKSIIMHELIHYFDNQHINLHDKISKLHSLNDSGDVFFDKYVNSFWEVNAHLLERLFKYGDIDSVETFINKVKNESENFEWFKSLNEKNKRKVLKRIYDFYKNR
jgi:hypothetical protein